LEIAMSYLIVDILLTTAAVIFSLRLFHQAHHPPAALNETSVAPLEHAAGLGNGPIPRLPATPGSTPLAETLRRICRAVGYGSIDEFTAGAKLTYELVLNAFAAGDLRDCHHLLGQDVRDALAAAIAERQATGDTVSTMFIGFRSADVVDAGLAGGIAWIEVRFVAEMVSVTRDRDGKVTAGHPNRVDQIAQRWTFEKELRSGRREWLLVATEAEE
jgi:predicted lipid-binding transport protein (Tim44 family)